MADAGMRKELLAVVDTGLLRSLLQSGPSLQRIALALLGVLLVDAEAALLLQSCMEWVAASCERLAYVEKVADVHATEACEAAVEAPWGRSDLGQALGVLRQAGFFLPSTQLDLSVLPAAETLLALIVPGSKLEDAMSDPTVVMQALVLVQELASKGAVAGPAATQLIGAACSQPALRGSECQVLALGLVAEQAEAGNVAPVLLDAALSEAMSGGTKTRQVALHLAAEGLSRYGLSFGLDTQGPLFARLRPLLALIAGELQLGLEGYAPKENTCAACAALEAAIVAFGRESAELERARQWSDVEDCLRQVHRAISLIYCYCADIQQDDEIPVELAFVARVAAAWQLEDPEKFSFEFERSLPALCRLHPAEFAVLLPCLHELQDWHLTPALAKVLDVALASQQKGVTAAEVVPNALEVWRQCALMLTEVALDAAAYLPDAPLPEPPTTGTSAEELGRCRSSAYGQLGRGACPPLPQAAANLPRPLQAADPKHDGVRRLCMWSYALWQAGVSSTAGPARCELGSLCGALLVSVPAEAVQAFPAVVQSAAGAWAAVAEALLGELAIEAATWRLSVRLAGFALDRHCGLAEALARLAVQRPSAHLTPPLGLAPGVDEDDEWAPADEAAMRAVSDYLALVRGHGYEEFAGNAKPALGEMD